MYFFKCRSSGLSIFSGHEKSLYVFKTKAQIQNKFVNKVFCQLVSLFSCEGTELPPFFFRKGFRKGCLRRKEDQELKGGLLKVTKFQSILHTAVWLLVLCRREYIRNRKARHSLIRQGKIL